MSEIETLAKGLTAGTYSPLDAPHMRNTGAQLPHLQRRPLEWLNDIRAHRDRLERVVRGIGPREIGTTTDAILGANLLRRAHAHLIIFRANHLWDDAIC